MATGTFQKSHKEEELLEHKEVSFFTASCISVRLCVYRVILQNAALTVETSQEAGSHITETQLFQAVNTKMWVFVGLQLGLHTHWPPHLLCLALVPHKVLRWEKLESTLLYSASICYSS